MRAICNSNFMWCGELKVQRKAPFGIVCSIMGSSSSKLEEKRSKVKERTGLIGERRENGSIMVRDDHYEKEKENTGVFYDKIISLGARVANAVQGEQIAAGWPDWLAEVASEAIIGWIPRTSDSFNITAKIGTGTYSNVYKAYDRPNNKIVALKKVWFATSEPQSVKFTAREILILRRLDHQNIIKLEGLAITRMQHSLYLIFEYMAHDLTRIISCSGVEFTETEVKCYMHQLLSGIEHCHSCGVLHRDIKSSNILIDDIGRLKIADFGLSTFYDANTPLTSRVGTLWYRSPELLLGATHYGPAVDLWSTGCVLAELYTHRPIMPGKTEVEQLYKIFKLCGSPSDDYFSKLFPDRRVFRPLNTYRRCIAEVFNSISTAALGLLETLLSVDPDHQGTATSALRSEFFTSEPFACDPSSLPRYQLSNDSNAELLEEKAASLHILEAKGKKHEYDKKGSKKVRARQVSRANAGLAASKLDHHGFRGEKINSSSPLTGTSSNVAQTLREHDHLWESQARVGELEVHESLLQADFRYAVPFGIPLAYSYGSQMIQNCDEYMQEVWPEKRDGFLVQATAKNLRLGKSRLGRPQAQEWQTELNTMRSGSSLVSAKKIDELLEEHDRQIQQAVERSMPKKKMVKVQA